MQTNEDDGRPVIDGHREKELREIASERIPRDDPSHDLGHALRIVSTAKRIAAVEGGDLDVIIPAALFHDLIVHPKDSPASADSSRDSADAAESILRGLDWYPEVKIAHVRRAIERCSFSKDLPKDSIEEEIVQDADLLESLGAIAVARTFCSTGQMKRVFYDPDDPTAEKRVLDPKRYALDLFPARLFMARERLATHEARRMAGPRELFLHAFYERFMEEIGAEDAQ